MQKKEEKKVNNNSKKTEISSVVLETLEKPIDIKKIKDKNKKTKSVNRLYKKYSIKKDINDRINFDDISNKQKRKEDSEINFIPEEVDTIPDQIEKKISLLIITALSLLFVIFCFFILFFYKDLFNKEIENASIANRDLEKIYQEEKIKLEQASNINKDIKIISELYGNHVYWSNLFTFFEENIVDGVYIKDMNGDIDGRVAMTIMANDYEDVAKQILVFKNSKDEIDNVEINSMEKVLNGKDEFVNTKIILKINQKILLKNE